jgi:uncharacterized protein
MLRMWYVVYMTKILTLRLEDRVYDELSAIARANGTSLSDIARAALLGVLSRPTEDDDQSGFTEAPIALTTVERTQLALLHRILARLVKEEREDGDFDYQIGQAQVLERGYVAEYDDIFGLVEPELSRAESALVMDVLDMFTQLEWSYDNLSDLDRASIGDWAGRGVRFGGFDANSRLEGRLLTYALHLIEQDKWENLAKYFDSQHERGNSHHPMLSVYERMLEAFNPIWRVKVREAMSGGRNSFELSPQEIKTVTDALIHPDNRK